MVFDYAGQGASGGTIGFDNAKTDHIPEEIDDAIAVLTEKTGLPEERIILLGHSMGGRAILRLMYDYRDAKAETRIAPRNIQNLILLSPEVNYLHSAQASLFAGTNDETDPLWGSLCEKHFTATNVYLFGSTADDVVSDGCVLSLYQRLGGRNVPERGPFSQDHTNAEGSLLRIRITDGVLHSYQMYSPRFAAFAAEALREITGGSTVSSPSLSFVYAGWFLALAGISLLLYALCRNSAYGNDAETLPRLTRPKAFLLHKLLLWLPGILFALLLCSLCVLLPFGSPIMNIPYMCFISGYGLVMLIAYRKGCFHGTQGKLPKPTLCCKGSARQHLITLFIVLFILAFLWAVLRLSMYRLMPVNARIFWLVLCAVLMTVGFYIGGAESDMLRAAGVSLRVRCLYSIIQYIPLLLFVLFYLVIGSYSGLIGQLLNVMLMYILFVPLGSFLRRRTANRLLGAALTAFSFQAFMITSAALISLF